jgi:ABC-type multidrug transport system ATPase subunit
MQLEIRNISKTYANGVKALDNVSLTIPTGMFGLLGPNGAGKSTLMRSIATLQDVDEGSITLGTIDVLRDVDPVRRMLGYLPQDFGVYPKASASMLLEHFATLKGITEAGERRKVVDHLLKLTNLWDVRKKRLGSFSGGMRQRFGIAQALLGDPKLIIVDEPTAGLDPEERNRFLNLLSEIGENIVVILSTHIVDDVSEVCSNMAIISEGKLLLAGSPQEAVDDIRGKTWKRVIAKSGLDRLRKEHNVISTRLSGGKTVVHVFGEQKPGPDFETVVPDLQDVYFAALNPTNQRNEQ